MDDHLFLVQLHSMDYNVENVFSLSDDQYLLDVMTKKHLQRFNRYLRTMYHKIPAQDN